MGRMKEQQIEQMNDENIEHEKLSEGFAPYFSPADRRDRDTQTRLSLDRDYTVVMEWMEYPGSKAPECMLAITLPGGGCSFVCNLSIWAFGEMVKRADAAHAELDAKYDDTHQWEDIF